MAQLKEGEKILNEIIYYSHDFNQALLEISRYCELDDTEDRQKMTIKDYTFIVDYEKLMIDGFKFENDEN